MLGSIVPKYMAITESKRQSDLEKRLKLLRQQVYGKLANQQISKSVHQPIGKLKTNTQIYQSNTASVSDVTYLFQDLSKIFLII